MCKDLTCTDRMASWPHAHRIDEGLDVLEPAFCPDCDGVHAAGECPLEVIERDPLLVRMAGWLAGKVAP